MGGPQLLPARPDGYGRTAAARPRAMLEGWSDLKELAPGMVLRRLDVRDLQGASARGSLRPGLHIALVVGGRVNVTLAGQRLALGPRPDGEVLGVALSVREPDGFVRESCLGDIERTVLLRLEHEWMDRQRLCAGLPALRNFAQRHMALRTWQASGPAVAAAEQMLRPPVMAPSLWRLYQQSRALAILVDALEGLQDGAAEHTPELGQRERLRMMALRELLDEGGADALSLAQIAARACISVNTLQRHFRAMWGTTVAQYLRERKLARARLALEVDGVSVTQAAWLAGYNSAANFATAFRRRFGMTPGQVRARRR